MNSEQPLLQVVGLQVSYNRSALGVDGVNLHVMPGQIVALLGANGAGKTTTLRGISGFLGAENAQLTGGTVRLLGELVSGRLPHEIARRGMVIVPERNKIFATLTVSDNLTCVPTRAGGDRKAMEELIFEVFPALLPLRSRFGGHLSGGERQMLAISKALIADPIVLLIDELSLGIAPVVVMRIMEALERIRRLRGMAMIVVEQNAAAALSIADYGYIMRTGHIVLEGSSADLLENADVRQVYLGLGESGEVSHYGVS